jgi:hypothetical protein
MRLFDRQLVAAIIFRPLLFKRRVKGGKQLAGDIIGTVQQLVACACATSSTEAASARYPFFSDLTAIAHPYQCDDFLMIIIFITV